MQILIGAAALELAEEGHTAGVDSERVRVEQKNVVAVLAVEQAAVAAVLAVAAAMVKMMVAAVASMAAEVESSAVCALHHITYVEPAEGVDYDFWL